MAALVLLSQMSWSQQASVASPDIPPHPPRVFLLDGKFLDTVRLRLRRGDKELAPALARLEWDAQQLLAAGPFSVVNKKPTPPSGDKHDYMSQAPYFWPDPASSNGLPYIRRDGERNPELRRISDHREMDEMANHVETLALAFYFTGREAYAEKASALLRIWFFEPATRMNPNLQYAQAVPGVNSGRGTGLIESRSLTRVVDAVGLLAGSKAWSQADQRQLEDWFKEFLRWMLESKHGQAEGAAKNNHGTYYDVQVASFAFFLGRPELATRILSEAREKRIAVQIEPDGKQPLELVRTRAWSYSVANLSGLVLLARLGENVGVDLWHYETADGRSIRKALDFLAPFGSGEQKWPYKQLGEWPKHSLDSLIRQAAIRFPKSRYGDCAKELPPLASDDRSVLVRPAPEARPSSAAGTQ
jgi:hypothetical protein